VAALARVREEVEQRRLLERLVGRDDPGRPDGAAGAVVALVELDPLVGPSRGPPAASSAATSGSMTRATVSPNATMRGALPSAGS
jgi:hypothetical protein